jgi:transcriptional regulator with XRE-family HTH domain
MLTKTANAEIGMNVKRWREFREIKQEELAKQLKITPAALSHIENGKIDITIARIHQISEALRINFLLLFSSPQQAMDIKKNPSNDEVNNVQHDTLNQDLIEALKTELQCKNEQINFLQYLLRSK